MNIVPFNRSHPDVKKLKKHISKRVFIQASEKYHSLVSEFHEGLLPWELFLDEISKRTGSERPETEFFWVELVKDCKALNIPVKLIEPDIDKVLKKAVKKMNLKDNPKMVQEARLWFLSGSGYLKHFYSAFDFLFFWMPFRVFFRNMWLGMVSFVVNLIPGDQRDVLALIHEANGVLAETLSKRVSKIKEGVVFLDENIAGKVRRMAEES